MHTHTHTRGARTRTRTRTRARAHAHRPTHPHATYLIECTDRTYKASRLLLVIKDQLLLTSVVLAVFYYQLYHTRVAFLDLNDVLCLVNLFATVRESQLKGLFVQVQLYEPFAGQQIEPRQHMIDGGGIG